MAGANTPPGSLSRTFRLKSDAELWARQKEVQLDRGELPVDTRVLRCHTLADLLERYATTIVPRKRSADRERYMLRVILRHPMARLSLHRLTPAEVAKYRDDRLAAVSGDTVRRELAIVRHCLEIARHEWGFALSSNPVHQVTLPRPSNPRERRATADELERLLAACEATSRRWLQAIIQFAVETGMRRSELLAMRWDDVDLGARTVLLRSTKNGHPRTVPLSPRALEIIKDTPRYGDIVFGVSANAVRLAWERLRRRAGVSGLRFHDLRHEAVSRFFEKGLNMPEVAAISPSQMRAAISRFRRRIDELEAFDPNVQTRSDPKIDALEARIDEALSETFGHGTPTYQRYSSAGHLDTAPISYAGPIPMQDVISGLKRGKERAIALLGEAVRSLEERLGDLGEPEVLEDAATAAAAPSLDVFIVHGHDDPAKTEVARLVERAGLNAVILHEQPNAGKTIIEKFEHHGGSAGFAVVLLTPDDVGGPDKDNLKWRARQNVIGEMFWFAGRLGRDRVCALIKGDVEMPSDFAGVGYTEMDDRGAWKAVVLKELKTAGYEVDWEKALP